jgi:hypothetical protein
MVPQVFDLMNTAFDEWTVRARWDVWRHRGSGLDPRRSADRRGHRRPRLADGIPRKRPRRRDRRDARVRGLPRTHPQRRPALDVPGALALRLRSGLSSSHLRTDTTWAGPRGRGSASRVPSSPAPLPVAGSGCCATAVVHRCSTCRSSVRRPGLSAWLPTPPSWPASRAR